MSTVLPAGNWTVDIVSTDSDLLIEACYAVVTLPRHVPPEICSVRAGAVTRLSVHLGRKDIRHFTAWHDRQGGYGTVEGVPEYTVILAIVTLDETHGVPESFMRWLDGHVDQHPSLAVYYILPDRIRTGPMSYMTTTMWERQLATASRPRVRVYETLRAPFHDVWHALLQLTPMTTQTP
jgi:hypothetical protein